MSIQHMTQAHVCTTHDTSTVKRGLSQAESVYRSGMLATFGVQEGLPPRGLQQSVAFSFFTFSVASCLQVWVEPHLTCMLLFEGLKPEA